MSHSNRKLGVVYQYGSDPDQHRIMSRPQAMNESPRRGARDPTRLTVRQGNTPVQGACQLERDKGPAAFADTEKTAVLPAAIGFQQAADDFDPLAAQPAETAPRNLRVRIADPRHDASNSRLQNDVGAGPRAAGEATRLQRHRERCAPHGAGTMPTPSGSQRHDLRMRTTRRPGRSTPEDAFTSINDGPDAGNWMGPTLSAARLQEYGFDVIDHTGLASGTVYPALSTLERKQLVESWWEKKGPAHSDGRPRRKYYRVTAEGSDALREAMEHFQAIGLRTPAVPSKTTG